jgi:peptidoglycan/xylan/chitin deacetylase (PgdA/CDA1 family)
VVDKPSDDVIPGGTEDADVAYHAGSGTGAPSLVGVADTSIRDSLGSMGAVISGTGSPLQDIRGHRRVCEGEVKVYLSFDDGPHTALPGTGANYTENIMMVLGRNSVQDDIKALFCVQTHVDNRGGDPVGQRLISRLYEEGHIVAVHTGSDRDHVSHKLRVVGPAYDTNGDRVVDAIDGENALDSDMIRAISRIGTLTGGPPKYVRPTYGSHNAATRAVYSKNGLKMLMWDIDSEDSLRHYPAGAQLANALRNKVRRQVRKGKTEMLVLFHDIKTGTQAHLDDYLIAIFEGAQDAGKFAVFPTTTDELDEFLKQH